MTRRDLYSLTLLLMLPSLSHSGELGEPADTDVPQKRSISYALPSGGVEELLAFIEDVKEFQPQTPLQSTEYRQRAPTAMTAAAKRILGLEKDQWSKAYQTAMVVLLRDRIRLLVGADPTEQQRTIGFVRTFLMARSEKAIRVQDARLATAACQMLERYGESELAARSYSDFAELLARQQDAALTSEVTILEGAARRLALPGKPLELQGTTSDGNPLDWSAYRGKVVLVCFLSAQSHSCLDEMRYAEAAFRGYRDRGLDVVVVCADPEHDALEELLSTEGLPWELIQRREPDSPRSPPARLGVTEVPVSILVDKEGVVVSVRANRHHLGQLLEQQLGLPAYGVNLLKNGGFESGLTSWTTGHATTRSRNPSPHNGAIYLFGSSDGSRTGYTFQQIDLVERGIPADKIDVGAFRMEFGGWQSGYEEQRDSGMIEVVMRDSSKEELDRKDLGWFHSNHRWVLKEGAATIAAGTRFIEYGFHAKYYDGARNMDAYLDDAYLMVVPRSEERHEIRISELSSKHPGEANGFRVATKKAEEVGVADTPPEGTEDDFTHWMDEQELNRRSQTLKPNGLWVTAVEGRWHDRAPQYRIREKTRPKGRGFSWYWWYDLDERVFAENCDKLLDNGFHLQHFRGCPCALG